MAIREENRGCIAFTFDLGAVIAAIIALVGGIILGGVGVERIARQPTPTVQVAQAGTPPLSTYNPYPPNPTYTPYPPNPTYTPYPTFTPRVVTVTATPLVAISSGGAQSPAPGSIVLAGQEYTKDGMSITAIKKFEYIASASYRCLCFSLNV